MPDFGDAERRILAYFTKGLSLIYNDENVEVVEAAKPTCAHGEPKTDIYVRVKNADESESEIKISYKKENADFIENKTNSERAEQLFGDDWREIIERSTIGIRESFEGKQIIFKEKSGKTEKGSITLGWKFELLNKPGGELSGLMDLTRQQVYDVYAGTNLSDEKKNSTVNGRTIRNSGVADYILMSDTAMSAQDVIDQMVTIETYIDRHPEIYFACKALNYRTFANKYDGNRPLSVQVAWSVEDGTLKSELIFDRPLELNGTEMANRLLACLRQLNINNTDDL